MDNDTPQDPEMNTDEPIADIIHSNAAEFNPLHSKIGFNPFGNHLNRMMTGYFMDYASYVIKDRAIPDIDDGLKPVQRRILHTLFKANDGKYHKVANIVGDCMKYHPHGDSSIYGALVNIANKEYFIDKQGNFGNILTGDNASAARYIECRLTPLALEVMFNPETTNFIDSYDGRNLEPLCLPAKVPSLLMSGTEGIAVGMATKIMPHNFNELLKAQIKILRGQRFEILPDFLSGGIMDATNYDLGNGKLIVRAKIEVLNHKTLVIKEVPPGTTTESLMSSIEDAAKAGKIKISSIQDYTAESVEIEINLSRGVQADWALDALYAFTQCEVSLSPNITVIKNNCPVEVHVGEILYHNTQTLVNILRWELLNEQNKLNEKYHDRTLERIFIEERIYKRIEECTSQPEVLAAVRTGLNPFLDQLRRDISEEDIDRLLRIPIRRISLFDISKNNKELEEILKALKEVAFSLDNLKDHTINFIKNLLAKYGKLYPRLTEIKSIEKVDAKEIAVANVKLGYDKVGGYIGTQINNGNHIKCTEFDRIIILTKDGKFKVTNISDKLFVGRFTEIFVVDKEQIYSVIYTDKKSGLSYHKRCKINKFILDKEYLLFPKGNKLELIDSHYGIVLDCHLEDTSRSKGLTAELIFDDVPIRSATAKGFKTASRAITKFLKKKRGSESKTEIEAEAKQAETETEEEEKNNNTWKAPKINFTQNEVEEAAAEAAKIKAEELEVLETKRLADSVKSNENRSPIIEEKTAPSNDDEVSNDTEAEEVTPEAKEPELELISETEVEKSDTDIMGGGTTTFVRKIDPDSTFSLEP
ncbi:DNA topoisomerase IV subunit A [Lentisphaera profundi]|uniref:DNA topoisomerase IV subunit A n=1 Tax=Lentisphaera profundi TaxID=1658616 RepID=A0ABY7W081_9BACT|nr:DNA topoisomerase IV subunit A [Lentisphaera profundi]WDE98845.1 DNA topoisomerase IV subunit A [Lentisphaera profundi]